MRHWRYEAKFLVADIKKDVLIGLDFLQKFQTTMDFRTAELVIGKHRLLCQDEDGKPLSTKVQALRRVTIPARTEQLIEGRMVQDLGTPNCTIEALASHKSFIVGNSVVCGQPNRFLIRVLNPGNNQILIPEGKLVATASPSLEVQTTDFSNKPPGLRQCRPGPSLPLPEHVTQLFNEALPCCPDPEDQQQLKDLLTRYGDVFSTSSSDVGHTTEVTHSIPIKADTAPVKQRPPPSGP